ncbi:MAG: hypothetical protein U5M53_11610 [Rhodoferax sp.]|nr:hypothetical protein [Rhodoferax sp.]
MTTGRPLVVLMWLVCLALPCAQAQAQSSRDPTVAPGEAEAGGPGQTPDSVPGYAVVIQDGKPHLVVGTRLVPVGQKVGNARLERITETEIWFREGGQLRKEARFAGITRTAARPPVACAAPKTLQHSKNSKTPRAATTAAPCEGAQP